VSALLIILGFVWIFGFCDFGKLFV